MNLLDPTGEYVVNCAQDDADCARNAAAFEKARGELLTGSYDPRVKAAAAAWGKPGEKNGITVSFGPLAQGQGGIGIADLDHTQTSDGSPVLVASFVIATGQEGTGLLATVAHEGSHVQSYQAYAAGWNMNNPYDQTNNISHEESEKRAYMITHLVYLQTRREKFEPAYCQSCAIGFGVEPLSKVNARINEIITNENGPYADHLKDPLFTRWLPLKGVPK